MYNYSSLIHCKDCGQNFRGKKQRGVNVYICSGYNNRTSNCKRYAIKEIEIEDAVERHIFRQRRNFDFDERYIDGGIHNYVKSIEVFNGEEGYVIHYKDSSDYSIISKTHLKY